MVYKRFRINCVLRVLILAATIFLLFFLIFRTNLYAAMFIIGCLIIYEIYSLIHYVEMTNRDLTRLLDSIKHSDFTQTFIGEGLGSSFNELKSAFNDVITKFRSTRAEKEEHFRYLQTVVQHVGIALICYQPDGEVELINTTAKRLLRVIQLRNVNDLKSFSKPLIKALFKLKPGEKVLVKVDDEDEILQLVINATEFKMRGLKFTLVSIQNISSELEEKEMEAWQNLIRVLTHEIMNSVTPIASLASTASGLLTPKDEDGEQKYDREVSPEIIDDIYDALNTIQKRSHGLLNFVDAYRNLTRIPKPNFKIFPISELSHVIEQLMKTKVEEKSIDFTVTIDPESLELTADPELIEQVLINLMLNAIHAVENKPDGKIELKAGMDDRGRTVIQVRDNGAGIMREVQEKIFIPFFTTKKKGSGIGLSLSRQIMRLHRGTISVQSEPDVRTVFTLRF